MFDLDYTTDESNTKEVNTSEDEQQNKDNDMKNCVDKWVRDLCLGAWFKENSQAEKEMLMIQATQIKESFNPLKEYADFFPDEIPSKLLLMRKINYEIRLMPGAKQKPEKIFSHDRFKDQILEKIHREMITGRTFATTDTENAVLMFTQLKKGTKKARFLLNCIPRNLVTIKDKTLLSNMDELLNWIIE